MSIGCKSVTIPLVYLRPAWVEFTSTKGILRVLKPIESRSRAHGLIFICPRCKGDKKKEHYNIFLFNKECVPPEARPQGRFVPTFEQDDEGNSIPEKFTKLTLKCDSPLSNNILKPQDVPCKWEGWLNHGEVSFIPHFWERNKWKS